MYRLMTKQSRQEARKAWINGQPTEIYKDLEILAYERNGSSCLTIWKGNAGNPYVNYSFRKAEQMQSYILNEKAKADSREEYKKEEREKERSMSQPAQASKLIKGILKGARGGKII